MIDWFILTCGGAALYSAGRWLQQHMQRVRRNKQRKGSNGQPLRLVVAQCEGRWFLQDLKLATEGDCDAMVRLSHMLMAGYGTKQDHAAAADWMRQAWAMQNYKEPGYCLYRMLDVRDSDIPKIHDATAARPAAAAAAQTVWRARAGHASSQDGRQYSGSSGASGGTAAGGPAAGSADRHVGSAGSSSSVQQHIEQPQLDPDTAQDPSQQQQQQQQQQGSSRAYGRQHLGRIRRRMWKEALQSAQQSHLTANLAQLALQ